MKNYTLAALAALTLLCPAAGWAQGLTFAFTDPAPVGTTGSVIQYDGTVTNTSGSTLYLSFDSLSLTPAAVAIADDSVFFDNVTLPYLSGAPVSLPDGGSLLLPVFAVTLDPTAAAGSVASGVFSFQADTSPDPVNPGTGFTTPDIPFDVTIAAPAAVPETSTTVSLGLLLALGLGGVVIAARRKKVSAPSA